MTRVRSTPSSPSLARPRFGVVAGALLAAAALTLAGCADSGPRATPPGRFAAQVDLGGQTLTVGGKEFTEQVILCKMTIALLQSAGATAVDRCQTTGSTNVRASLTSGQIDLYWEYTGTAWRTYLGQESRIPDPDTLFEAVRGADVGNGVSWLARTPFNDTYALGVRTDTAERLRVRTISDLAALASSGSPDASLCVAQEFTGREDGLLGLLRTYGFRIADGRLITCDLDAIPLAVAAGSPCVFGEVAATDGQLNPLDITTLVDDRGWFPPYNAAPTVRTEVLDRAEGLDQLGTMLSPTLTEAVMRGLNEQVSVGHRDPDAVARAFLHQQGLIG